MLWETASNTKDSVGEGEGDSVSVTPILVPLQSKITSAEKSVPVLVPDVQDLKDQFQQQQSVLAQIKETLKQNESQFSSKEKQIEVYANKLSQIKARTRNGQGKNLGLNEKMDKSSTGKTTSNLSKLGSLDAKKSLLSSPKAGRKKKISELHKCLEENKLMFEERTGKEQTDAKKIETLVEQLTTQLVERDKTIHDLQKTIEEPKTGSRRIKLRSEFVASKMTQTHQVQPNEASDEIIALQNKIYELEANVLDLEENLKEKESVIEARTQAVTLLSQDLSLKGKSTLENLEETRQEMRTMQSKFVAIEDQLKKDLRDKDDMLSEFEEKNKRLESTNSDLSCKNAELQEKLIKMQEKFAEQEAERKSSESKSEEQQPLKKKIAVLTKELDDRNKAMIKMKIEHRNKLKSLNETLESLRRGSDEKAEIFRLRKLVEELKNDKAGLENRVAELEDEKASEKKMKEQINELEIIIQRQSEELSQCQETISLLMREKSDLVQKNQDQRLVIENLNTKMIGLEDAEEKIEGEIIDSDDLEKLKWKLEHAEYEYNRKLENLKIEHGKEIEMLESYYNSKLDNSEKRELEEYRISTEINNIHVEEQIDLLVREKQQLLEKLKSLSGVSSTDSLTFDKLERSDIRVSDIVYKECLVNVGSDSPMAGAGDSENRLTHLQKIVNDQQTIIAELEKSVRIEREKVKKFEEKIKEMEKIHRELEEKNAALRNQVKAAELGKENHKMNSNTRNKVKKIEIELSEAKTSLSEQSKKIEDLNEKLREKEDLIKKYTDKIELFEKEDWDRQNHWENEEDGFENVQEIQKKCLSLENSLIELNEQFEMLRKENIEIVHKLSEEKVKRRKLLEELQGREKRGDVKLNSEFLKEKMQLFVRLLENLETKISSLETTLEGQSERPDAGKYEGDECWRLDELEQKLEWSNIVLTSKETEIFRLQNLLEDRNKAMEIMEVGLNEHREKLAGKEKQLLDLTEQFKIREIEFQQISRDAQKLNETAQKSEEKDAQFQQLSLKAKELEESLKKKSFEIQELIGCLNQKKIDMANSKAHFDKIHQDMTKVFQERLDKMNDCLKNKESDFEAVWAEKKNLEAAIKDLMTERESIHNQKTSLVKENEKLHKLLAEKERCIVDMNEKLRVFEKPVDAASAAPETSKEMEDLKTKMKILAANLKKKVQNEVDLTKQLNDLETCLREKDKALETLQADISEIAEKWTSEKSEKEQIKSDLNAVTNEKANLERENMILKKELADSGNKMEENRIALESQSKELQSEIERLVKACNDFQIIEQQFKGKVAGMEKSFNEVTERYHTATLTLHQTESALEEERKANEEALKSLAEISGKFEEVKFKYDQALLEKKEMEKRLGELERDREGSATEKTLFDAKLRESLAVIENLESELAKAQDHVKTMEEKLFVSEERRMSLESKNEEMIQKITEDSQNSTTIDDLAARVDELLAAEKTLMKSLKAQEEKNGELSREFNEACSRKADLEKEAKTSADRISELTDELKRLKNSDLEKNTAINELTKEVDKMKTENKNITEEYDKLNRDYEQFEVDFKENLENSQSIEKSLRHKIEELTSENAALTEKLSSLSEERNRDEEKTEEESTHGDPKKRKKKSVTFRTDEVEYIKELKQQLHTYDAKLKRANEEIETLKSELFREQLKGEVFNVVEEARDRAESLKSLSEESFDFKVEREIQKSQVQSLTAAVQVENDEDRKFDASVFFGADQSAQAGEPSFFDVGVKMPLSEEPSQGSEFDSLMWDDGWGTDGHLEEEYLTGRIENSGLKPENRNQYEETIGSLEAEISGLKTEVEKLSKELQDQAAKYTKALKKLKEQKILCEKLQLENNKWTSNDGLDALNAAIMDELKLQIEKLETKEKEYLKTLEKHKMEKESLLKRIDILNVGNEKFLEMKERQDNDVEIWQRKNSELLREISELRQLSQQQPEAVLKDDNALSQENRELLKKLEALEWAIVDLTRLIEEKDELLKEMSGKSVPGDPAGKGLEERSVLQKEIEELKNVKEVLEKRLSDEENKNAATIDKLSKQLTALASENETLQDILSEMKSKGSSATSDSKIAGLKQNLVLEENSKAKDAEIDNLKSFTMQLKEELAGARQRLLDVQSEMEISSHNYRSSLMEMENVIKLKNEELQRLKREQAKRAEANEFETIDLNRKTDFSAPREDSSEPLRQKILELEDLLRIKEETLVMHSTFVQESGKEMDDLKQRNFQLEEFIRSKDEESNRLMAKNAENQKELEELRGKMAGVEEYLRHKDHEIYQIQTVKESQINELNMRIIEMEGFLKTNNPAQEEGLRQRIFDLENMLRLSRDESERIRSESATEAEILRQKMAQMENLAACKTEEVNQLMAKLADLEKSYNDSKIEIERLLNEEKLNSEEKFVEPFQNNIKIPVAFELEAVLRSLDEEKQKTDNLRYELSDREKVIEKKFSEIDDLTRKVSELENRLASLSEAENRQRIITEESYQMKAQLEKIITDLQKELDSSNLQLGETRRELEQYQNSEDETRSKMKNQIRELETILMEITEKKDSEIIELKSLLEEKTNFFESLLQSKREEEMKWTEKVMGEERARGGLEMEMERLRSDLMSKETDIAAMNRLVNEERIRFDQIRRTLEERERELADLRQTLSHMQVEIESFRNFEKQVKELRVAQLKGAATPEGDPDLSGWTEYELAELSTKLQSDLDTALYMLHQRDVRCDELTFELMQLIEERDTLQLRLSSALRVNEEFRSHGACDRKNTDGHTLEQSKDLVDQSNDRQAKKEKMPGQEDLRHLADKISELHSISYLRDKTVKDDSVQRHAEQMNLLSRVSDSDAALGRDAQNPPSVLLNWARGKGSPKVMHI